MLQRTLSWAPGRGARRGRARNDSGRGRESETERAHHSRQRPQPWAGTSVGAAPLSDTGWVCVCRPTQNSGRPPGHLESAPGTLDCSAQAVLTCDLATRTDSIGMMFPGGEGESLHPGPCTWGALNATQVCRDTDALGGPRGPWGQPVVLVAAALSCAPACGSGIIFSVCHR